MMMRLLAIGVLSAWCMSNVHAAGFALIEQNTSGMGNAFAGQAASAQDASTIFYNPAGLTYIKGRQAVGALHLIKPSSKFTDASGVPSGGDAGGVVPVPNFYYAMDINPDLKFGLGVGSPFGLKTDYSHPWGFVQVAPGVTIPAGSVHGILSDMKTLNVNPSLGWRVNDRVSLGAGVNLQYVEAELSSFNPVNSQVVTMKGDDTTWGYNLGLMFDLDAASRIGLSYRSEMDYTLGGTLAIPAAKLANVSADVTLPDSASFAYFRQLSDRWSVKADATWTGWSSFDTLAIINKATGTPVSTPTVYDWKDSWRVGIGADYRMDDQWTVRFGVARDETPIRSAALRTPGIPDESRTWLAIGAQYRLGKGGAIDLGYAHLFVEDAAIAKTTPVPLVGSFENNVDMLSVQYTHSF